MPFRRKIAAASGDAGNQKVSPHVGNRWSLKCIWDLMTQFNQLRVSESEEGRYRLLVEAITDYAIYMLDPEGMVASWNPGAQRFKGYVADEIIGQHFSRFYTDQDRANGVSGRSRLRHLGLDGGRLRRRRFGSLVPACSTGAARGAG